MRISYLESCIIEKLRFLSSLTRHHKDIVKTNCTQSGCYKIKQQNSNPKIMGNFQDSLNSDVSCFFNS